VPQSDKCHVDKLSAGKYVPVGLTNAADYPFAQHDVLKDEFKKALQGKSHEGKKFHTLIAQTAPGQPGGPQTRSPLRHQQDEPALQGPPGLGYDLGR